MVIRPKKDLVEIFGYSPVDTSKQCRSLWKIGACPFINKKCSKTNHDKTIIYGTCSVVSPYGDCIICPKRLYADNYSVLREVAKDAFGNDYEFLTFEEFIPKRNSNKTFIVALGQNSGREVQVGQQLSMDWVLAKIGQGNLIEYTGIEVQSIDITGNYRDCWYAYKNLKSDSIIPNSGHGMNWANVHKRLIPQLIRKGLIYSRSKLVKNGLYFILPEIVYQKFEDIIGKDITRKRRKGSDIITVHTYSLSSEAPVGEQRDLVQSRKIRFTLDEFSKRFINGPSLPKGEDLDNAIRKVLGL